MPLICFVTCANAEEAAKIATGLLEKKLVACANILPEIQSYYRWKGMVDKGSETLLILKTRIGLQGRVIKEIKEMHSYELPAVECFKADSSKEVVRWIENETR